MLDLGRRIADAGDALTPTERRLAALVLDDPTAVAFGTVADLARRAGTSGPTVMRFAVKLGFQGFADLQGRVRNQLGEQLRRPTDRLRVHSPDPDSATALEIHKQVLSAGLAETLEQVDDVALASAAGIIAGAVGRVLVLPAATSATPGRLLADNLGWLRSGVVFVNGPTASTAAELADIGPDDVLVVVDFPRYESITVDAVGHGSDRGTTVLAITDGPLSPLAHSASMWIGVSCHPIGPFDSVLAATAVAELLVAEVAGLLRTNATNRLDRIEALWTAAQVFHPDTRDKRPRETP
jgi:DNA-binding MurR/RpiR family transcriptional regulator